ncbi:SagB/ThcOx family dehydrogenase [Tissierella creatinophila]|uniref:Nitroreductase family protein n=1 Tax=Tissierella creatinophila DSM 6911 TaxID=1123403 RepID=A0A1U7M789_TISCR|nr:SagB/ThcOx family dehydrogenase [Tissierella creatinophila]OLS03079.1 nitroreductase family protein [Tissierella creatinophila DSM 6911]
MNRQFMKSYFNKAIETDQDKGIQQPPLEKPFGKDEELIGLPEVDRSIITKSDIMEAILDRKSHRVYKDEAISLEELSYLLTMTQKVKEIKGNNYVGLRPVPSAGGRHPFETYLAVLNVEGLKKGIYRYLPLEHKLLFIKEHDELNEKITIGANRQKFAGKSAVTFVWSCVPYRTEWRYADRSYKIMLLDAGHICQALYLACETIGLGTCAIASYSQELIDNLIDVDGENEFTVYLSPVGRV